MGAVRMAVVMWLIAVLLAAATLYNILTDGADVWTVGFSTQTAIWAVGATIVARLGMRDAGG